MPSTKKRPKSTAGARVNSTKHRNAISRDEKIIMEQSENLIQRIESNLAKEKNKVSMYFQDIYIHKASHLKKTVEELLATGFVSASSINNFSTVSNAILPAHSTLKKPTQPERSSRLRYKSKDDEGYLTAGSRTSSLTRESKARKTTTVRKNPRRSRSCSNKTGPSINYTTPANQKPPNFGYITPKVKPNTPQALLRRPELGEMAFSVQGSPLMTSDTQPGNANINIPLNNGRVISIQPCGLLNDSQVPHVDSNIMEQMNTLQRNLMKVIARNMNK